MGRRKTQKIIQTVLGNIVAVGILFTENDNYVITNFQQIITFVIPSSWLKLRTGEGLCLLLIINKLVWSRSPIKDHT